MYLNVDYRRIELDLSASRERLSRFARCIASLVILSLSFPSFLAADVWKTAPIPLSATERAEVLAGGTIVKLVNEPGQTVKAAYAVGVLSASPKRVAAIVRDYAHYRDYMPYVSRSTAVPDHLSNIRSYQYLDLPWPISDRWYIVTVEPIREDVDGRLSYSWSYIPHSGNIVDTHGTWSFVPLSDGRTLAFYFVSGDLGIRLPSWVINLVTRYALPDVFARIAVKLRL